MANNQYVNKVEFGNQTVMDISDTDAQESDVAEGKIFYKGTGQRSVGTGNYYSPNDTAETDIDDADYFPFYDSSASGKRKSLWSNIKAKLKTYFDTLYQTLADSDSWSSSAAVDSNNQVTFTGLNDTYGYSLYCNNGNLVGIEGVEKTGSGTAVQLVFTLSNVSQGDTCKLRIMKG